MKSLLCGLVAACFAVTAVLMVNVVAANAAPNTKKAIVVVSFGTTFDDARKSCIESVETKIKEAFPDYEVRRAFTSKIVMKRLADRGIFINSLEKTLDDLKAAGYEDIVLQSTHLTPGEEYDKKILAVADQYRSNFNSLVIGRPVLMFDGANNNPDDFAIAMAALCKQLPKLQEGEEIVFMGHGSPHQHNPAYQALQDEFDAAKIPVTIGVVEETDHPNLEDVIDRLAAKQTVKSITLMPLMLVAGDHANNDMAGDEPDSWKNILQSKGYSINQPYLHGLGENIAFQEIYVQHIKDAISGVDNK